MGVLAYLLNSFSANCYGSTEQGFSIISSVGMRLIEKGLFSTKLAHSVTIAEKEVSVSIFKFGIWLLDLMCTGLFFFGISLFSLLLD